MRAGGTEIMFLGFGGARRLGRKATPRPCLLKSRVSVFANAEDKARGHALPGYKKDQEADE